MNCSGRVSNREAEHRYFVLLQQEDDSEFLSRALQSPLGWVKDTLRKVFSEGVSRYKESILVNDGRESASISDLIAGLVRSRNLQGRYPLANYHHTMFTFQQAFHSSYRARKGKVLEEILRKFCQDLGYDVPEKEKWQTIANSLKVKMQDLVSGKHGPDIDLVAESEKCLLVIQIRSRDDTGGTTAKASLAKALLPIVNPKIKIDPETEVIYLVGVWEPRGEEQFPSLVEELVSRLRNTASLPSDTDSIKETIRRGKGLEVRNKVFLRIAYGVEEIESLILEQSNKKVGNKGFAKLSDIERLLEKPDDLWLTYAVVSLELSQLLTKGKTNIDYLKNRIESEGNSVSTDNIDDLARRLHSTWADDVLPFERPADNYLYIRDMLYLYLIYQKCCSKTKRRRRKSSKEINSSRQQLPAMEGLSR
jgi:hypothetical protein